MFYSHYKAQRVPLVLIFILVTVLSFASCAKKSVENFSNNNSPTPSNQGKSSGTRTLSKEIRLNNLLKMEVANSKEFNAYLQIIQQDQNTKNLRYFLQDGQIFDLNENKLDSNRPACSVGLFKRRFTSDSEAIYFKYISENGNKLVAVNSEVSVSFTCLVYSAKSYNVTINDLNSVFKNIAQFSLIPNFELKQNINVKTCGDKSYFHSIDQMLADCDETKTAINGSVWKLISRSKSGLETWLSPSGNFWSANLGRNTLIQETTTDTSVCKNNSLNTFGLANLSQNEKPLYFDLPTLQDYKNAINEGLNEIVQNNNTNDLSSSLHIYWIKPENLKYYIYKFLKNSIEDYQWVNKLWNIRCIGKFQDSNTNTDPDPNSNPNSSTNPRNILISNLPTKQIVLKNIQTIKESQLLNKSIFQSGELIKDKAIQKTLPYCRLNSMFELSKDYTFSIFLNRESISSSSAKVELSSISNRVVINCYKPQGIGFTVSDLDHIFENFFEVIIPYTYSD